MLLLALQIFLVILMSFLATTFRLSILGHLTSKWQNCHSSGLLLTQATQSGVQMRSLDSLEGTAIGLVIRCTLAADILLCVGGKIGQCAGISLTHCKYKKPTTKEELKACLKEAAKDKINVRVSGGSYASSSLLATSGMLIDTGALTAKTVCYTPSLGDRVGFD